MTKSKREEKIARGADGSPCSILMRFYAALIASLLSNHRGGVLIGARGVSPTESVSARVRQWKKR